MATNTFSSLHENSFRLRAPTSYTQRLPVITSLRWFGGTLSITGWVRDVSSTPQQRRVYLHVWPHMTLIATYISDPANGGNNYFFNGLVSLAGTEESYVVSVHSIDQSTAAEIKDNLTPV